MTVISQQNKKIKEKVTQYIMGDVKA